MGSSNKACAENTEKRVELQLKTIKLHRIITKVHKIKCFTHTKILTPAIFFDPPQNFVDPPDPYDLCQSLTHTTHEPTHQHYPRHPHYLADCKTIVNRNNNGFNYSRTPPQIFPLNIFEILRIYSGWWLPNLPQQTKSIFKVGNIVKNITESYVILMSLLYLDTAWLEHSETVALVASEEKVFLKIS